MTSKSFNSPVSLMLLSFIMSLSLIMANIENWQVKINEELPLYIYSAVLAFSFGCLITNIVSEKREVYGMSLAENVRICDASAKCKIIMFVAGPVFCTLGMIHMSLGIGSGGEAANNLFRNIYEYSVKNSSNFLLHQFREIVVATAEISVINMFVARYFYKKHWDLLSMVPLLCYVICTMLSSDRNIFLRFMIYSLSLWIFFISDTREKSQRATNRMIFRKAIIVVAASAGIFYLLGKVKSYTSNFERMIGIYGGSGLYNFNLSIDRFGDYALEHGNETFSQLFSTLRAFGINIGGASGHPMQQMIIFKSANGYTYASNIYSAMMPYALDFGLAGIIFFSLILGLVFGLLYAAAKKRRSVYLWGIYSMLVYAVIYFTITEQFFLRFHLGMVYELFWFTAIYYIVFGINKKRTITAARTLSQFI